LENEKARAVWLATGHGGEVVKASVVKLPRHENSFKRGVE